MEVECSFSLFSLVVSPPSTMISVELSFSRGQTCKPEMELSRDRKWISDLLLGAHGAHTGVTITCAHSRQLLPGANLQRKNIITDNLTENGANTKWRNFVDNLTLVPPPHVLLHRDQGAHSAH